MPQTLVPWLGAGRIPRVAVVGDVILDEYLEGEVSRISPEAPVPVHLVTRTYQVPGGAANTARNIKLAGGDVVLLSVVGRDEAGKQLRSLLEKDKIDIDHLLTVEDRPTIRKTRITANSHQLVRVDWEQGHPITDEAQDRILSGLEALEFDALLISDYGKGALPAPLLRKMIGVAKQRGVPVVVDPKGRDYARYLHATLITPNRKEACEALGLDPLGHQSGEVLGKELQRVFGLENILVTLGAKGMVLVPDQASGSSSAIHLPAVAREVFDVSGAGDTVVAIMTLCLAAGSTMAQGMHIANTAAAIVVGKWGTQPVELGELEAALRERPEPKKKFFSSSVKITNVETLTQVVKPFGKRSKKVVFTNGCFDILHSGHVTYLEEARALGDLLVVGINTDESVQALKGPARPIVSLEHRMRVLAALGCVDFVVPFGQSTPLELIQALVPDILVKGGDYDKDAPSGTVKAIVGADVVREAGGRVETIPLVPGQSTTNIVSKMGPGDRKG
jgi:D-beta-D-heptose 7-phosphate kinase/D-beta-D-heptose 1-phosphate adenosyltransferase